MLNRLARSQTVYSVISCGIFLKDARFEYTLADSFASEDNAMTRIVVHRHFLPTSYFRHRRNGGISEIHVRMNGTIYCGKVSNVLLKLSTVVWKERNEEIARLQKLQW